MAGDIALLFKPDGSVVSGSAATDAGGEANMDALMQASAEAAAGMQQAAAAAFNLDEALRAAQAEAAGATVAQDGGGLDVEALQEGMAEADRLVEPARQAADEIASAFEAAGGRALDAISGMVIDGEFELSSFKDIAKDLLSDILGSIAGQIGGGFGGAGGGFGAGGGGFGGVFAQLVGLIETAHTGGVIGTDRLGSRFMSPDLFAGAPRFQTGGIVGRDEVPILAHEGEGVFTPGQMEALGGALGPGAQQGPAPVTVNINVTAGVPEAVRREFVKLIPQIEGIVRRVVADDLGRNRAMRQRLDR